MSIFSPIDTAKLPSFFEHKDGEVKVPDGVSTKAPIATNSFYDNLLVEKQDFPVWTHPYSLWFSKSGPLGLAVYHAQSNDIKFIGDSPASAFYAPGGIKSVVLSSTDFLSTPNLSLENLSKFSATARFSKPDGDGYLDCPLVQGMGFATGIYHKITPKLSSLVGFKALNEQSSPGNGVSKYKIDLDNDSSWLLFVTCPNDESVTFSQKGDDIVADKAVDGTIVQLAFASDVDADGFDQAAGCYATDASLLADVSEDSVSYSLEYSTEGKSNSGNPLVFALPHHLDSLDDSTKDAVTKTKLNTTTKGEATGILAKKITMKEDTGASKISFDPFTTIPDKKANFSESALNAIRDAAKKEANGDVKKESDQNSMYTSGKILAKYALILYVCHFVLKDDDLSKDLLQKMKDAIGKFANNKQQFPLFYDTQFKGIVSSAKGGEDFGNGHFNDHHFHFGYHIHAAAVTAHVDKDMGGDWTDSIKQWVNCLVRDVANPSTDDGFFPVFRNFDFYNGHSWAKGLYGSGDGKDEESSSEDYNFTYAMKMWAQVIEDKNMEHRADLMLAITRRAMNHYFLYDDDNKTEPEKFVGNKVSGILFENKIDHSTYFGKNPEYIHGIHMLPITPVSSYIRGPKFVKQEWEQKLKDVVDGADGGWKGVLMLNRALFDPDEAFKFFNDGNFDEKLLDNGQSRCWSLAYCAGVGASS